MLPALKLLTWIINITDIAILYVYWYQSHRWNHTINLEQQYKIMITIYKYIPSKYQIKDERYVWNCIET